jgi:hypothetical protein
VVIDLRRSVVRDNHEIGVFIAGGDGWIESTVIANTHPQVADGVAGRGLNVQLSCNAESCDAAAVANVTLLTSLVDQSADTAVIGTDAQVQVAASVVRATAARQADGLFGDGVTAFGDYGSSSLTITDSLVADSIRAGIASFGATMAVGRTHVRCAAFALSGEPHLGKDFAFDDLGANGCGCPAADQACKAVSMGLQPPDPLDDTH